MTALYGNGGELRPADLARCMMDTYRAMNKHYIPTGYELSSFAKYASPHAESSTAAAEASFLLTTSVTLPRASSSSATLPKTPPCADLLHFALFIKDTSPLEYNAN
jgi:hypothetical protein